MRPSTSPSLPAVIGQRRYVRAIAPVLMQSRAHRSVGDGRTVGLIPATGTDEDRPMEANRHVTVEASYAAERA